MATSNYDKFRPNSVRIHSGRAQPLKGTDLSVAQETLAQDMSSASRVVNNMMNVLYYFSSATLGKGGLVKTTEDRFDYTYDFPNEYGIRPADFGVEGRNIFVYASENDTQYSDPDFDELHSIFWSENSEGERRPNTIFETFLEVKDYVDSAVASVGSPTYTLAAPQRVLIGSNESLDLNNPSLSISQFGFDTSVYPGDFDFIFACVGTVDGPTPNLSMTVELYNLTNAEFVSGATLVVDSSTPQEKKTVALTVSSAPGDLNNSLALYEVRLTFNNVADGADVAVLGSVYLIIE